MSNPFIGKHGPLLIAEIGGNHEGDFDFALDLTHQAIDADVDIIKYQIYTGATLVNKKESPDRVEHFKKFELTQNNHVQLAELCIQNGVQYSASIWDESVLEWIDPFLKLYKIGSGDLTAFPLLKKIAEKGKPIILSTGLSSLDDIVGSVNYIRSINPIYDLPEKLAILQCTSLYPNKDTDVNLNVLKTLRKTFEYPIGYSDHTEGTLALRIAFSMGAKILEFHFTDSREGKTFRDHFVSLTGQEVKELIRDIKIINNLHGSNKKKPTEQEISTDHVRSFRRAVYPIRDLSSGDVITEKDLAILRPNHGIDARDFQKLIGKSINRDVKAFNTLDWSFIS
jgi:N-acetylneuraminate synthase/N,N'-diacetyllegionaminate synthase